MAYLDKHSTLDPVMVSVVSSNPTGGNVLKFFKLLDVNFSLKCKCDLVMENSNVSVHIHGAVLFLPLTGKLTRILELCVSLCIFHKFYQIFCIRIVGDFKVEDLLQPNG